MANVFPSTYPHNQRQPGKMAAFLDLLGMGPMPPPRPEEVAVAVANHVHMLDHPDENKY